MAPVTEPATASAALVRGEDRSAAVESLVADAGGRVGIEGLLADLGRTGRPVSQGLARLELAFTWDERDRGDRRWWPQGVTGSWDRGPHHDPARGDGDVLVTTAYAKAAGKVRLGSRITVHDVSDPEKVRYEHVLLVHPTTDSSGRPGAAPVHAHAGGAAWVGRHLHVAATEDGFHTFDLADVVPADRLDAAGLPPHGHRYVLPARTTYRPTGGGTPLRFSFLSVAHGSDQRSRLVVGEYGRGSMTRRLWTYELDTATGLPVTDRDGVATQDLVSTPGVQRMQGAVLVGDRLHVVTSRGRWRRGSIWTERSGRLVQHEYVLPPGPEDLSHRASRDQLWTVTEYPHSRMVAVVDRRRFG
jgi:hypothetical protein